jgi:hypothetical protein
MILVVIWGGGPFLLVCHPLPESASCSTQNPDFSDLRRRGTKTKRKTEKKGSCPVEATDHWLVQTKDAPSTLCWPTRAIKRSIIHRNNNRYNMNSYDNTLSSIGWRRGSYVQRMRASKAENENSARRIWWHETLKRFGADCVKCSRALEGKKCEINR